LQIVTGTHAEGQMYYTAGYAVDVGLPIIGHAALGGECRLLGWPILKLSDN